MNSSTSTFQVKEIFLFISRFMESLVFSANSVDPYQTPRSVAADLGLHGLLMSFLWKARYNWVKYRIWHDYRISTLNTSCQLISEVSDNRTCFKDALMLDLLLHLFPVFFFFFFFFLCFFFFFFFFFFLIK